MLLVKDALGQEKRMKQWIANEYIELSRRMRLDKIGVTKLCQSCKISRGTFYYHFKDIPDLIFWIYQESIVFPVREYLQTAQHPIENIAFISISKLYQEKQFYCQMAR